MVTRRGLEKTCVMMTRRPGGGVGDGAGAHREDDAEGLDAFRVRLPVDEMESGGADTGSAGVVARARRESRRDAGGATHARGKCAARVRVGRRDVPRRERSGSEHPAVRHRPGDVVVVVLRGSHDGARLDHRAPTADASSATPRGRSRAVLGEGRPGQRPFAADDRARGQLPRARGRRDRARVSRRPRPSRGGPRDRHRAPRRQPRRGGKPTRVGASRRRGRTCRAREDQHGRRRTTTRVAEGVRRFARNPPLARERLAATRARALRCAPASRRRRGSPAAFSETARKFHFGRTMAIFVNVLQPSQRVPPTDPRRSLSRYAWHFH